MNTTNLFVELVVIGMGVLAWVVLLGMALLGFSWIPTQHAVLAILALPALTLVYVFGIIWDRLADALFERLWVDRLRSTYFADDADYVRARQIVVHHGSPAFSELLEYSRSRQRICRGWSLNAAAIGAGLVVLTMARDFAGENELRVAVGGLLLCNVVAVGAWYAWRNMMSTGFRKTREQAAFLMSTERGAGADPLPGTETSADARPALPETARDSAAVVRRAPSST